MLVPPVAATQDGVFTRKQARAAGAGAWMVRKRITDGTWRHVLGDAYVLIGTAITPRIRIRAAALATEGVVSHTSAAHLLGLGLPYDGSLHVITHRAIHLNVDEVIDHRVALMRSEWSWLDGIAVTTRTRTLLDLLATSPRRQAESLLFRTVQQAWLTASDIAEAIGRRRHTHGNQQLRELGALISTGAHSVAEARLHVILRELDGLQWSANAPLHIAGRTFVVDVLLPGHRVVIEIDGRRYHSDSDTFQRDRQRQNALTTAGYLVLRFTWLDLTQQPLRVRHTILDAVAR